MSVRYSLVIAALAVWLSGSALADVPFYNYTGDQHVDQIYTYPNYTPWVGGGAVCSAPYQGQGVGGYFRWFISCPSSHAKMDWVCLL